jgi:signal transduction histidine kinase
MDFTTAPLLSASSLNKSRLLDAETVEGITALVASPDRSGAIADLAASLQADDLVIFVADPEIGVLLPAPGFPQTLPGGGEWRALVQEAADTGSAAGSLLSPEGMRLPALGQRGQDGSVLVVLGAATRRDRLLDVVFMLPLVAAALRAEMTARSAQAYARMEEHEAQEMRLLVSSLEDARRQAQDAFRQAQVALQTRDRFVAMASHELKTPLASLTLQVQLLERLLRRREGLAAQWDRVTEGLWRLHRQVDRLVKLAEDLLDVSISHEGRLSIAPEPVGLTPLTAEIVDRFQQTLDPHGSQIELVVEEDVTGEWDPHRLDQVITNLLSNALKYGGGKPIQVVIGGGERMAQIMVRDRGVGISARDIPRIFKRFERIGGEADPGGIGLGLHIASEIVRLHGGSIQVESEPGKGAAFIVTLPRRPETIGEVAE